MDDSWDWGFVGNNQVHPGYLRLLSFWKGTALDDLMGFLMGTASKSSDTASLYCRNQNKKKAVETYAVEKAKVYLAELWGGEPESRETDRVGYDLDWILPKSQGLRFVEVKGTQRQAIDGVPPKVIVTEKERRIGREHQQRSYLVIVHDIECDWDGSAFRAQGGVVTVLHPWVPAGNFVPTHHIFTPIHSATPES
jgi:hypothetical protein